MKNWVLLAACVLLSGCDYTVSLVDKPETPIDRGLLGLWQRTNDQATVETVLILPLDDKEYLVAYSTKPDHTMYARGCLARVDEQEFIQLKWIGSSDGGIPDDDLVFQYVAYAVEGGALSVRLLDVQVVEKDEAVALGMAAAIRAKRGEKDLFKEAMVFQRSGE